MIRFLLATVALPLLLSTGIPLPAHAPKHMPPEARKMVMDHLKSIKQFDLKALGIPVEKSLRFAGAVGNPASPTILVAVSPKKVEPMVAWYHHHLKGWKLSGHVTGKTATFTPPKGSVRVTVSTCLGGNYQMFPCASVLRFYKHAME